MSESFGARLRQQRERRQISLADIAGQTKIGLRLLEGLESDDVSQWPSGIFRRGYARAYAQCIGLDPDAVVQELMELHPDPGCAEVDAAALLARIEETQGGSQLSRLRSLVGSAVGALSGRRRDEATPSSDAGRRPMSDPPVQQSSAVNTQKADPRPVAEPLVQSAPPKPELGVAAHLCTELGRLTDITQATSLLDGVARVLDAAGLIIWVRSGSSLELTPILSQGYPDNLLARLPTVHRDADNATANAFRTGQAAVVASRPGMSGALAVPLITLAGAAGVFAVELRNGGEQSEWVRALATIFAAQLATLVASAQLALSETSIRRDIA